MITVQTSKPIATDSPDHIQPFGTARDNSVHAVFNQKLYRLIRSHEVRLLDLGCAGGGLVRSILDDGGFAVGIDGSDYSRVRRRAEWPVIPGNLFTADITEPFGVLEDGEAAEFGVITAWEFLEHIREDRLPQVFANVRQHLATNGIFLGSISEIHDIHNGLDMHQTVRPRRWWGDRFFEAGFQLRPDLIEHFGDDWIRGPNSAQAVEPSFPFAVSY